MLIYKYFQPTRCTWQAKNVNNFPSHWIKFSARRMWFETTDIYVHSILTIQGSWNSWNRQYHEDVKCEYTRRSYLYELSIYSWIIVSNIKLKYVFKSIFFFTPLLSHFKFQFLPQQNQSCVLKNFLQKLMIAKYKFNNDTYGSYIRMSDIYI